MIRALILSSALSVIALGGAIAADLPAEKGPPAYEPPPPPPPTWTGFYVGVNGGYGGDRFDYPFGINDPALPAAGINGAASLTSGGGLAGGQIGFNYQFAGSNFVAGLEADADWTDIRGNLGINATAGGTTLSANAGSELEYLGTVRARFGYAWDNILPYVTGGFAYGEDKSYYNLSATPGGFAVNGAKYNNHDGWTVGAGLEYKITQNLTFKTEYLYVDLGSRSLLSVPLGGGAAFNLNEHPTANIVRAGFNYLFDFAPPPAPPVVAKY
jgi:outer membrane immunogenic protein